MPISQTDQLFQLIKSLTKSEKRAFTIYASRSQDTDELKYMHLFEIMDKAKSLNDEVFLQKLKDTDKSQYSNLKRHLYGQLLTSLRLIHIHKKVEIEIREFMDFADILYSKGLYLQSLKIISKAKDLAHKTDNTALQLALLDIEKTIESRHITRTGTNVTPTLTERSMMISQSVITDTKLSNLMLKLHSFYIQNGHVKNKEEKQEIITFFEENLPQLETEVLNEKSKIILYQCLVWYYYILQDFNLCHVNATLWVNHFKQRPEMIDHDPDLFMRGYHYLLTTAFFLRDVNIYDNYLDELEIFRKSHYKKLSNNSQIISFLYVHHGRLNHAFLHQRYTEGLELIPNTVKRLNRYKRKLDPHQVMVLYFKVAWMYLMAGKPSQAVDYLNEIQKIEVGALRQDIQIYTRLMLLMAHYDLGNLEILVYLIRQAQAIGQKLGDVNLVQMKTLAFFSQLVKSPLLERKALLKTFVRELEMLQSNEFEKRAFIYLNILEWGHWKLNA